MGSFTPLESPSINARDAKNRKHQLPIPAGRQGGRGQSPALSNGVYRDLQKRCTVFHPEMEVNPSTPQYKYWGLTSA